MIRSALSPAVSQGSRVHARLLDAFIALTEAELEELAPGFAHDSLVDYLESMRAARSVCVAASAHAAANDP